MRKLCAVLATACTVVLSGAAFGGVATVYGGSQAAFRGHDCKGEGRNAIACQSQIHFARPALDQCAARRGKRCP